MTLNEYLGLDMARLLGALPFSAWATEKVVDEDSDECIVRYLFPGHSIEVRCDRDDRVLTIFLDAEADSFVDDALCAVGRNWTREQVLAHFGTPVRSGPPISHPVLGSYGKWDRFAMQGCVIHVEYALQGSGVRRITMMHNSVVPG